MKKLTILTGILCMSAASLFGQTTKGNVIVDVYGGAPNWGNVLFKALQSDSATNSGFKTNGGALSYGARVEYMMADNFGLGIDANYEVSGFGFNYQKQDQSSGAILTHRFDYTATKIRAMVRMNYHFAQTELVDAYLGVGAGYRNVTRKTVDSGSYDSGNLNLGSGINPIAFRVAVGSRFYFTDMLGGMLEFGIGGGGIIQFGVSAKF